VSIASGDFAEADKHFDDALAEMEQYPAPLVAWKVHAARAQLKSKMGDEAGAKEASAQAFEIVNAIAANVTDEKLRDGFLKSAQSALSKS